MKNQRIAQENTFRTHDDVDLFYRYWPATQPRRGAIALGVIATVYGFWLCYAAGDAMLLSALLFAPGILVHAWQRRVRQLTVLTNREWWLAIALVLAAVWALTRILQGTLQIY